jgi:RNA polymerase sigma-70 factor (ECF subfamily)
VEHPVRFPRLASLSGPPAVRSISAPALPVPALVPAERLTVEEVYRRHGALVVRWAMRLGGPRVDLDDVVQDVFVRVQKDLAGFRGDALLTTWLYQVTRNVVGHRLRKERFRRWLGGTPAETAGHLPSATMSPVEAVEKRQAAERLYRALDGLSEKDRTVFVLFELERLGGEEIARIMDAKVGTVWVWLHRARARFFDKVRALDTEEARA